MFQLQIIRPRPVASNDRNKQFNTPIGNIGSAEDDMDNIMVPQSTNIDQSKTSPAVSQTGYIHDSKTAQQIIFDKNIDYNEFKTIIINQLNLDKLLGDTLKDENKLNIVKRCTITIR